MKKVVLLATAAAAISFSSCEKERTCKCTITSTYGGTPVSSSSSITYKDVNKRTAKTLCVSSTETDEQGVVTTRDCKLD